MTAATHAIARPDLGRLGAARLAAGYGLIAGTIPYLTLKAAWLTGSTVGITDRAFAQDPSLTVLNAVTAGMDVVAIGVALALTHRWGQRLPAWLVLVPMFVGTGFLAPIAVSTPVQAIAAALAPGADAATSAAVPLAPWVQPLVYAGFSWQGVTLLTAFVLYTRVRWPEVFRPAAARPGRTHTVQVAVATGGAVLAFAVAAMNAVWAFGVPAGLGGQAAATQDLGASLRSGIHAAMAAGAAAGVLAMVHRARVPFWLSLAAAWVGTAALFSWGLWGMVNVLAGTVLASGTDRMALVNLHGLATVLAGLLLAVVSLFALADRYDAA